MQHEIYRIYFEYKIQCNFIRNIYNRRHVYIFTILELKIEHKINITKSNELQTMINIILLLI